MHQYLKIFCVKLGLITLWPMLLVPQADANGYQGTINSAETHTNLSISSASGFDTWTFTANKGDEIIVNANATSGSLLPSIFLYNPQGSLEASDDNNETANQLVWQLKTNGLYTIIIEDFYRTDTGNYNITFFDLAGAITSASNPYGGPTRSAQTTNGNIITSSDLNAFQIYGQIGNGIIINATATNGSLLPSIFLYNPQGALEASDDNNETANQLAWQLKTNGLYTIVVEDFYRTRTGNFNITFSVIPGAPTSASNPYGGTIMSGESTNGIVQLPSDFNEFQFYGSPGQQVEINTTTTSGSLLPSIFLYNPQGTLEASDDNNEMANQLTWQLETNGLYTIVVEDFSLARTGKFALSFSSIPPIANPGLYNPYPTLGQTLTSLPKTLSWSPVAGATNYDLYFGLGVTGPLQSLGPNFAAASFPVPPVNSKNTYYWQVVANTTSGAIQGPYWWFNVLSTNQPPLVKTSLAATNRLILSWPAWTTSFSLQTTTNLSSGNWVTVTNPFTTIGTNFVFTNTISGKSTFFRLVQ